MLKKRRSPINLSLPFFEDIETSHSVVRLDPETDGSFTLIIDSMESSHIHPNPTTLVFEYMRWIFNILDAELSKEEAIEIAHLGGGALSLPRALAHHFPRSKNTVVEYDAKLIELVRTWVDIPKGISIRNADAFEALASWRDKRFDVVIRDVFQDSRTPLKLQSLEAGVNSRRILKDNGLFIANIAMDKAQMELANEIKTLLEVFGDVQLVAEPSAIKKRRISNCLIIAGRKINDLAERKLRTDAVPVRIFEEDEIAKLAQRGAVTILP